MCFRELIIKDYELQFYEQKGTGTGTNIHYIILSHYLLHT